MRKILLIGLLMVIALTAWGQSNDDSFTVSLWVGIEDNTYQTRVYNEIVTQLRTSSEWSFVIDQENVYSTDIHLVVTGVHIEGTNRYAWSISFTPNFMPHFNNANVAVSESNISGMNWVARKSVEFVEGQLYVIYDAMSEFEEQELNEENPGDGAQVETSA